MMWREGGGAVQYVYHPDQPHDWGQDFPWRHNFSPGRWHTVEHHFVMNTPREKDGVLQAWIDGDQVLDVDTFRFRDVNTFAIDQFYISTHLSKIGFSLGQHLVHFREAIPRPRLPEIHKVLISRAY